MPKHVRKRQKISNDALLDDSSKDDEERQLESLLFGTKFVAQAPIQDEDAGNELNNLEDSDIFFIDEGEQKNTANSSDSDSDSDSESSQDLPHRKPNTAWIDPSEPPSISIASDKRLRKLRDTPGEDTLTGKEYESRLRRQFERLYPEPQWAKKARQPSEEPAQEEGEEVGDIRSLLSSTNGILSKSKSRTISPGTIAIERLRDVNSNKGDVGPVKCMAFHPKVPVLAAGTTDRRLRLYNVDGHNSPLLQTLHIPSLPISSCQYHPSGSHLLLTGNRPYYYVYDLQSGLTTQSKVRNIDPLNASSPPSVEIASFSGDGNILATAGRNGSIHLLDFQNSGQIVSTLKCSSGGGIKSLRFNTGANERKDMLTVLTNDAEVYLWDIGQRKCVKKWTDYGGFRGSSKTMSNSDNWLAIGSNNGLVNIYDRPTFTETSSKNSPAKTLSHLTTSISALQFNHDCQLLAVASKEKKGSLRLVHCPSFSAYSNWPTSSTPLGHVTSLEFSSRSEYLAVGNTRGRILLYWLQDYGSRM